MQENGKSKIFSIRENSPTEGAFKENVKREHYCVALWKSANTSHSVEVELTDHGWIERDSILILQT